jgi:hypothetical protein
MKRTKLLKYCPACGKDKYYAKAQNKQGLWEIRCLAGHTLEVQRVDGLMSAAVMQRLAPEERMAR